MNRRAHVVLPEQLINEIDALVGNRQRSSFIAEAVEKELMCRRQLHALQQLVARDESGHPELKQGASKYVRKRRRGQVSKRAGRQRR